MPAVAIHAVSIPVTNYLRRRNESAAEGGSNEAGIG